MYSSCIFLLTVTYVQCWQYFSQIKDYHLSAAPPVTEHVHSEYTFGECKRKDIVLFVHIHKDHLEVLGKPIMRGWLDLVRIPTCVLIRATSHEFDMMHGTAYNFQICVPRITYIHSQKRYKYYFYEWYIPDNMSGGMSWDLYFYGPPSASW